MKILILAIFAFNAVADTCNFPFFKKYSVRSSKEVKHLNTAYKLDSLTKKLKSYNKSLQDIEVDLMRGDTTTALNKWTYPFKKVETSYIEITNHRKMIDALEDFDSQGLSFGQFLTQKNIPKYLIDKHALDFQNSSVNDYLKVLKKDLDRHSKTLGNNIDTYLGAKAKLNSLKNSQACSQSCQDAVAKVLKETSITSNQFREQLRQRIGSRRSIDSEDVKRLLETDAKAFLVSKRKVFITDMAKRLKSLFNNRYIMQALFMTGKFSTLGKTKLLLRLFNRGFNHRYFKLHRPLLTKVGYSDLSPANKIKMLQKEIGELDLDDVLVDFSRASDGRIQKSFEDILQHIEGKPIFAPLHKRVVEAQKLGAKLGKISRTSPRNYDWLVGSIIVGGAALTYLSFDTETTEVTPADPMDPNQNEDPDIIEIEFDSDEDTQLIQDFIDANEDLNILESAAVQ